MQKKIINADRKLFSLIKILSEKRKTIPENPSRTPNVFVKLIFSLVVKKWARTVALKGVLAINIAAKLLWTFWTPYAIKKKGITRFTIPIKANQYQSFENASIFIFLNKHKPITGIAPKKILKKAIVTGP